MKRFRFTGALLAFLLIPHVLAAAELVMVEQRGCEWCEAWDEDIGQGYHLSAEGRIAPLRRVNIHDELPADLDFIRGLVFTPTFVLVHEGREFGRILGYPGEDFFWGQLEQLVAKLPRNTRVKARAGSLRHHHPRVKKRTALRG